MDVMKSPNTCFCHQSFTAGYTAVFLIPVAQLLADAALVQVLCAFAGVNRDIGELWIGHQGPGDPYDFDGNQVQLKVATNAAWTVDQEGIWTDQEAFALDKTKVLLLAAYLPTTNGMPRTCCHDTTYCIYYKLGNDAATTDKAGYSPATWTGFITLFQQIKTPATYKLSGTIKEKGVSVARSLAAYNRSTRELYSTGASDATGAFTIDAPDDTTEMLVVALDDDAGEDYNDLIYGRVKGVPI